MHIFFSYYLLYAVIEVSSMSLRQVIYVDFAFDWCVCDNWPAVTLAVGPGVVSPFATASVVSRVH